MPSELRKRGQVMSAAATLSAYLHRRVTANGSSLARLPFEGVLHSAPLP
jgi:hypothetical protein